MEGAFGQGDVGTQDLLRLMAEEEARKREAMRPQDPEGYAASAPDLGPEAPPAPDFLGAWRDSMLGGAKNIAVDAVTRPVRYMEDPAGAFQDTATAGASGIAQYGNDLYPPEMQSYLQSNVDKDPMAAMVAQAAVPMPSLKSAAAGAGAFATGAAAFSPSSMADGEVTPTAGLEGQMNQLMARRAKAEAALNSLSGAADPYAANRADLQAKMLAEENDPIHPGRGNNWKALKRELDSLPPPVGIDESERARLQAEISGIDSRIESMSGEMQGARAFQQIQDINKEFEPQNLVDQVTPYAALAAPFVAGGLLGRGASKHMSSIAAGRARRLNEIADGTKGLGGIPKSTDIGKRAGVVEGAYDIMGKKSPLGSAPYNESTRGLANDAGRKLFGSRDAPLLDESLGSRFADVPGVAGATAGAAKITDVFREKYENEANDYWTKYEASRADGSQGDPVLYRRYKEAAANAEIYGNWQKAEWMAGAGYLTGRFKTPQDQVRNLVDGKSVGEIMKQKGAVEQFRGEALKRSQAAQKGLETKALNARNQGAQQALPPPAANGQQNPQGMNNPAPPAQLPAPQGMQGAAQGQNPAQAAAGQQGVANQGALKKSSANYVQKDSDEARGALSEMVRLGVDIMSATTNQMTALLNKGRSTLLPKAKVDNLLTNTKLYLKSLGREVKPADIKNMPKVWDDNGTKRKLLADAIVAGGIGAAAASTLTPDDALQALSEGRLPGSKATTTQKVQEKSTYSGALSEMLRKMGGY